MSRHYVSGGGGLAGLFGIGRVTTLCGESVSASNGPNDDKPCTCRKCQQVYEEDYAPRKRPPLF